MAKGDRLQRRGQEPLHFLWSSSSYCPFVCRRLCPSVCILHSFLMTAGLNGTPLLHPNSLLSGTGCDSAECDREQESVRLEKQVAGISVQTSQGTAACLVHKETAAFCWMVELFLVPVSIPVSPLPWHAHAVALWCTEERKREPGRNC